MNNITLNEYVMSGFEVAEIMLNFLMIIKKLCVVKLQQEKWEDKVGVQARIFSL